MLRKQIQSFKSFYFITISFITNISINILLMFILKFSFIQKLKSITNKFIMVLAFFCVHYKLKRNKIIVLLLFC